MPALRYRHPVKHCLPLNCGSYLGGRVRSKYSYLGTGTSVCVLSSPHGAPFLAVYEHLLVFLLWKAKPHRIPGTCSASSISTSTSTSSMVYQSYPGQCCFVEVTSSLDSYYLNPDVFHGLYQCASLSTAASLLHRLDSPFLPITKLLPCG